MCRLDLIAYGIGAAVIAPLSVAAASTCVPQIQLPRSSRIPIFGTASVGVLMLSQASAVPALGAALTAERAFDEYETFDGRPLVVDYTNETPSSYSPAAALVLKARREGYDVCVAARRWPYWMENSDLCTEVPVDAVRIEFRSDGEFDVLDEMRPAD
jgi:hypothetical protein